MSFKEVISKYKNYLVLGGLGVGALSFLNVLPEQLPIVKSSTNLFYVGLILFSGYVFFSFFMSNTSGVIFERSVPSRNLGSSNVFRKDIARQRGRVHAPVVKRSVVDDEGNVKPSNSILNKFNSGD